MLLCLKLALALLGLTLPGYLLARLLGLENRWLRLAAAFPLSALLLVESVIGFAVLGIPLRFGTMAALLAAVTVCFHLLGRRRTPPPEQAESADDRPRRLAAAALLTAGAVVLLVLLRATLFPLSGFDTFFRWEGLARAMLQQQSLAFYPPVTADDYGIYVFSDGIPPLVASVYWWLYAAMGEPLANATSLPVALQLASALTLAFFGARHLFGTRAAFLSLLVAATSTLLVSGFQIGQETGFTALAVAGQLCCAWAAARRPGPAAVVAAALFAALGALARDYGPALALCGFATLAWEPRTRRFLPLFVAVAAACAAPWYLRNWGITGNPFYPHAIPGGFPVNPVHAAIIAFYQEYRSLSHLDAAQWRSLAGLLLTGAPLALGLGLPAAVARWRKTAPLLLTAALVTVLWLVSIGQTAGGVIYSARVLTPAILALSIPAGAALGALFDPAHVARRGLRLATGTAVALLAGYALVATASHPFPARSFFAAIASTRTGPPEFCVVQPELAAWLQQSDLPATGVLTDDMYLATILLRDTRFRAVMIWSPEVWFVFDPALDPAQIRRRLRAAGVSVVAFDNSSPTTLFLLRYPFFREYPQWSLLFTASSQAALFQLPAE